MSSAAIAEMVRAGLGENTEDEVCIECARTAGGNPPLARQLISALEELDGEDVGVDTIAAMGPPSVARFVPLG